MSPLRSRPDMVLPGELSTSQRRLALHKRKSSSSFGWFDVEALLTSHSTRDIAWWAEGSESEIGDDSSESLRPTSVLPPALERVFSWLRDMEKEGTGHEIDQDRLDDIALSAGWLPDCRFDGMGDRAINGKIVTTEAVTKADFSVISRASPSLAIGVYAHRLVRHRRRLSLWSTCSAEFLVVLGTENKLHQAWRRHQDFVELAGRVRSLRVPKALKQWHAFDAKVKGCPRVDAPFLRAKAVYLAGFLGTLIEELDDKNTPILVHFTDRSWTVRADKDDNSPCKGSGHPVCSEHGMDGTSAEHHVGRFRGTGHVGVGSGDSEPQGNIERWRRVSKPWKALRHEPRT